MPWDFIGAAAGALGTALGSYFSSKEQSKAANNAAQAQLAATNAGLDFQRQQLDRSLGQQQSLFGQALGQQRDVFGQALGQQQGLLDSALDFQKQQFGALGGDQARYLDEMRGLFAPYLGAGQQAIGGLGQFAQAGLPALAGQQALAGTLGVDAQSAAIAGISNGPELAALTQQGENAILQNASATGGLRGGNTQAALAQFRPQVLSQLINQRYAQLGGLAGQGAQSFGQLGQLGQFGAGGQVAAGQNVLGLQAELAGRLAGNAANLSSQFAGNAANLTNAFGGNLANLSNAFGGTVAGLSGVFGTNVADLLAQRGTANAGNALAQGQANANAFSGIGGALNQAALLRMLAGGGGLPRASSSTPDLPGYLAERLAGLPAGGLAAGGAVPQYGFGGDYSLSAVQSALGRVLGGR